MRNNTLEAYFQPLRNVPFPEKMLFLGSGVTRPRYEWLVYPSIRINAKTLDMYTENRIFAVLTQLMSCNTVAKHGIFKGEDPPYIFNFVYEVSLKYSLKNTYRKKTDKYILAGISGIMQSEYYRDLPRISGGRRFTTGSLIILFLLYADIKEYYIAGYDGYKKTRQFQQADGKQWHGWFNGHDLNGDWILIERAIAEAEKQGKKVFVARDDTDTEDKSLLLSPPVSA